VKITVTGDERVPVQVDGEAWLCVSVSVSVCVSVCVVSDGEDNGDG